MIDNFELIKTLLTFDSEDDFYHCQIIKRKKENPEIGSNSYIVKTYSIKSIAELDKDKEEMITLANLHDARVYLNLNKRSFEAIAFQMLRKVTACILNKDWRAVRQCYTSVCDSYSAAKTGKRWVLDIDTKTFDFHALEKLLSEIRPDGDKLLCVVPTKSGYHAITKPFDVMRFKQNPLSTRVDIHKDNATLMYMNDGLS